VVKADKCTGVSQILGGVRPGCPHPKSTLIHTYIDTYIQTSMHRCLQRYACQRKDTYKETRTHTPIHIYTDTVCTFLSQNVGQHHGKTAKNLSLNELYKLHYSTLHISEHVDFSPIYATMRLPGCTNTSSNCAS